MQEALRTFYGAPTPSPAFVDGLERRLLSHAQAVAGRPQDRTLPAWVQSRGHRWALAAVALLLALAATLGAIGPQRVWAEVQRLLGYVPGVGFVDLERTRVLTAPVALTREGVTLVVEQALARPQGTTVVIRSEGLPLEDELRASGRELVQGCEAWLRLPGGEALSPKTYRAGLGVATFDFAPLPDGVYQVTLEVGRLPLVPDGVAPQGWELPLTLRPATGEVVAALFPQPYTPQDAAATHDGITIQVVEVGHAPEETALRLQVQWENRSWEYHHENVPRLRDDVGHSYFYPATLGSSSTVRTEVTAIDPFQAGPASAPALPTWEKTVSFAPISSLAHQLTLEVDDITFEAPATASFSIDLGDDPQVGDRWPLDAHLEVAGFPVHITGARLLEKDVGSLEHAELRRELELEIAPVPAQGNRMLAGIGLDGQAAGFRAGSSGGYAYQANRLRASLIVKDGELIPQGRVQIQVRYALIRVAGPWEISWTVPGRDGQAGVTPLTLRPQAAPQERSGLALWVEEVVLSDRLTAVTVALDGVADGETLTRMPYYDPATLGAIGPLLYDDRSGRYEPGRAGTGWDTAARPGTWIFGPVDPLARRLTLRLPGIVVALPGRAAFDVRVPEGLAMAPISPDRPSLRSPSWAVDIPLEVAGYQLRFREAWLEEINGTTMLRLLSEPYRPERKERWLSGLRPAAVTRPDGGTLDLRGAAEEVAVERAFSGAGPQPDGGEEHWAALAFDVADPETGQVRPGVYHVELEGVTVAVRGPWDLTWNVMGQ